MSTAPPIETDAGGAAASFGPTILLVEDERSIGTLVRGYLERAGYRVIWVRTGEEALIELARHPVRMVVLDIGLPGMVGADDYVSKPFSPRELAARIKAVLRRTEDRPQEESLELGDVELRRDAREVKVAGEPVELTTKEFDLLAWLLEHAGIVFSREQLLDRVWGMAYHGGTRTVDVHVAQLRRKLGRPELIRTVRGAGYKAVRVRRGQRVQGTITVDGKRYFYAARHVGNRALVLLRPTRLGATASKPFLEGLLVAALAGAALAAIATFLLARAISRPVRRVAAAALSLAEERSPAPVPVEGVRELGQL